MKYTPNPIEQMGEYSLAFVVVDEARKHFRYPNAQGKKGIWKRMYETWDKVTPQMPDGLNYYCIVTHNVRANSKSRASFDIVGILSAYDYAEEMEEFSKEYRGTHKFMETGEDKIKWTRLFSQHLRDSHAERHQEGNFSIPTLNKLLEITK